METRPYSSGREIQPYSPHAEKIIMRVLRRALQVLLREEDPDINPADADFFALGGVERIRCKYRQHVLELSLSHGFFRANPRKKRKKKSE